MERIDTANRHDGVGCAEARPFKEVPAEDAPPEVDTTIRRQGPAGEMEGSVER